MGLDVYLYEYTGNKDEMEKLEKQYEEQSEANWSNTFPGKTYDTLSQGDRDKVSAINKKLILDMGLNEWGGAPGKEQIELPSVKYPNHLFKIGYFRSSYNDGGIEHVLGNATGHSLSTIFNANNEYAFQPDWEVSRLKAIEAKDALVKFIKEEGGLTVTEISPNVFGNNVGVDITSKRLAMTLYLEEKHKHGSNNEYSDGYSNASGEFFHNDPLKVVGMVHGKGWAGQQTLYVIHKSGDMDWYVQALEIVIETCEFVLGKQNKERYYLHWSG